MRILHRTDVVEAGRDWREDVFASHRRVVIDVGAGDGRWAYENARRDRDTLYIGLDPDAEALSEYAYRASRKPARGGVTNAVFVVASVEDPPPELTDVADEVDVIYPWAALLRGVLRPEDAVLRGLRTLAKPGARVELVLTYDASRDRGTGLDPSAPSLDERFIERLRGPYRAAGLEMQAYRRLSDEEALAIPSTWGHRLLHGRARQVFMVELATR